MTRRRAKWLVIAGLALVVGLELATVWGSRPSPNARHSRAQLQCKNLARQVDEAEQKTGRWPENLQDLLTPAFGNGSLLKNGPEDLTDPWGQPYQLSYYFGADGKKTPLVHTTAADGTPISQYGIGPLSKMQ